MRVTAPLWVEPTDGLDLEWEAEGEVSHSREPGAVGWLYYTDVRDVIIRNEFGHLVEKELLERYEDYAAEALEGAYWAEVRRRELPWA